MLPHPAARRRLQMWYSLCPNKSAANKPVDAKQHHCYGCRYGGVDRRHAAEGRCLADVIKSHSGAKVFIEQEIPALTRVVNGQTEHARMDLVFNLNGSVTYLDVSIVALFLLQSVSGLCSQHQTRTHGQKSREEQILTDTHTSTSFLSGPHAKKNHQPPHVGS